MRSGVNAEVDSAVEHLANEMDELLHALVATDTRSGSERAGQALVAEALRPLGARVETFEPDARALAEYEDFRGELGRFAGRANVVATFGEGDDDHRSIILNGHIDTVPPVNGWTLSPFTPAVASGRLHGLGSADMKAGLVGLVWALRAVAEADVPIRGTVILQSVVDEEAGGGSGTLACIQAGLTADAAIVAEPTALRLCTAQMGSLAVRFDVEGRAAHGNTKWYGVNAIEEALPLLLGLRAAHEERSSRSHPLLPAPQVNIGRIVGGLAAPIVADACSIEAVLSYHPGERARVRSVVSDLVATAQAGSAWLQDHPPAVSVAHDVDAYALDEDVPITACIRDAMASQPSLDGDPVGFPAGSDARLLHMIGGIPTVLLGPGSLRQAHVPDEYVDLHQFHMFPRLLVRVLSAWTNLPTMRERR